jgi:uncharacterized protein with HEPN domain
MMSKPKNPMIPWRSMAAARDRLIHDYFGTNIDIVWQIATVELPQVSQQLKTLEDTSK